MRLWFAASALMIAAGLLFFSDGRPADAQLIPTSTAAPIAAPATATPTPARASTIGGADFTLTDLGDGQMLLSWQGGTEQIGYQLARITAAGETLLTALAASATSAVDTLPPDLRTVCYQLRPMGTSGGTLRRSIVLCAITRIAYADGPRNLSIQSTASPGAPPPGAPPATVILAWDPAPGATDYVLVRLLPGLRVQPLPATALFFVDPLTLGSVFCYLVAARAGFTVIGFTDMLCAVP